MVKCPLVSEISEQLAFKFVTEDLKQFVDPQDLRDFTLFERDPARIRELTARLCTEINKKDPPSNHRTSKAKESGSINKPDAQKTGTVDVKEARDSNVLQVLEQKIPSGVNLNSLVSEL